MATGTSLSLTYFIPDTYTFIWNCGFSLDTPHEKTKENYKEVTLQI
jgi:hypothetical protein